MARLAHAKARAIADQHDQGLIIGSDQVCVCDGRILGKPGTVERAVAQLMAAQGRSVTFIPACACWTPRLAAPSS